MKKAIKLIYEQVAGKTGLKLNAEEGVLYGERDGFEMMVFPSDERYPLLLTVSTAAKSQSGHIIGKEEIKQFVKEVKPVAALKQDGNVVQISLKNIGNVDKLCEAIQAGIDRLTAFLQERGYEPCCQFCGQDVRTSGYAVGKTYMHLCEDCISRMRQDVTLDAEQKRQKKENLVGGIVGAFLGSLLGVLCIIFFSQLERVAVVSGIIMAVCTLKGYEMLGGKLTKKGIFISIVLMFVMTYIGDRLDWALVITREVGADWGIDFIDAYRYVPDAVTDGAIESGTYWGNIAMLYLFTVAGMIPTVISVMKERKSAGYISKIGSSFDEDRDEEI